jgi:hypothetical protein
VHRKRAADILGGPGAYKLATVTLTHEALTKHQAQLTDLTDPATAGSSPLLSPISPAN